MKKIILLVSVLFITILTLSAEPETAVKKKYPLPDISAGADVVTSYVWRGAYQNQGAAIQPFASISWQGLSLGTWASTPIGDFTSSKELDFTLSYSVVGLYFGVTDYWWEGEGGKYFDSENHYIEATIGYTFPFEKFGLNLTASTMVYAPKDLNADGKANYSTYLHAMYPFSYKKFDFNVGIGVTPFEGLYAAEGESLITDVNFKAAYNFTINEHLSLPVFCDIIFSPAKNDAYVVFGCRFVFNN